ncbi:CLUMA_CG000403, isoform A [Clunio marinus]|uniref:CLUMA_CG000403, isoform A n=1 Tax=Clunio marinus TaxID=568069 RepID=A0A1J1HIY1_9DIPT|nr:CLUMA_CG000403, isoform A [Clunio marinus]
MTLSINTLQGKELNKSNVWVIDSQTVSSRASSTMNFELNFCCQEIDSEHSGAITTKALRELNNFLYKEIH